MADDTEVLQPNDSVTASVGHEDGALLVGEDNIKEEVVFDYDDNDQYIGWHKEAIK